jgi:putative hydrolase of the HAD superfamily
VTIRGVLVDAAGCLIRPAEPVGETYARAARAQGVDLPGWRLDDAFARVIARAEPVRYAGTDASGRIERERAYWRAIVRSTFLAADSTVRFPDPDGLFEALFDHFARGAAWTLAAGAREGLSALRARNLRLGVASNFDHRLPMILEEIGIKDVFHSLTIPSGCGRAKPDPGFFAAAVAELGTAPAETVHCGDHPERDLAAARSAGLRALRLSAEPDAQGAGWADLPARVDALATLEPAEPTHAPSGPSGDGDEPNP